MNSQGITAITDHQICMKCLKNKATHTYNISNRGYGSIFDNEYTKFQVCDECNKPEYDLWFNESGDIYDKNGEWDSEEYQYENNINELIHSLPLESQELFYNTFDHDDCYPMEAQDWIDYKLNELPHEKCKEYGRYSNEERQAYHDRFPVCDKVHERIHNNGSSSCWCKNNAYGNSDGSCEKYNISQECYMCPDFAIRTGAIKTINEVDEFVKNEKIRLENIFEYATNNLRLLNENPQGYFQEHN